MAFRLLVEGADDVHLLKNVAREHGIVLDPKREIVDCGGIDPLLNDSLPTHLKASYDALAVVVDADLDIRSRWQAIRHRLLATGYDLPEVPVPEGTIVTSANAPTVGI